MGTGYRVVVPQFLSSPLQEFCSMLLYGHLGLRPQHIEFHFVAVLL